MVLVKRIISPAIAPPALNKYTKVDPAIRKVALMTHFGGLLKQGVAWKLGKKPEDAASDVSENAVVGAPTNETQHFRKVGHIKLHKCYSFLEKRSSKWVTLVWLAVCTCIMVIHFKLFKHGTWYNHRKNDPMRASIFDFCGPLAKSPAGIAMNTLAAIIFDVEGEGRRPLALLFLYFGSHDAWPRKVHHVLQVSTIVAMSIIWRKLIHYFKRYPWLLAPAFDRRRSEADRRSTLATFMRATKFDLDPGLGLPLQALVDDIEDYVDSDLGDFLTTLFERVVVTSTQVEMLFSGLTKWTQAADQGLPTLAAKSVLNMFKQSVERWRRGIGDVPRQNRRSRPAWMFTMPKGIRKDHLHIFQEENSRPEFRGDRRRVRAAFEELPVAEQRDLKTRAHSARAFAKLTPSPLALSLEGPGERCEGPLGIAARDGPFAILPSRVRMHVEGQTMQAIAREWTDRHKTAVSADPAVLETVANARVPESRRGLPLLYVDEGEVGDNGCALTLAAGRLLQYFQLALRFSDAGDMDPTVLLEFTSGPNSIYVLVGHYQRDGDSRFQAECFSMERANDGADEHGGHFGLRLSRGEPVDGCTVPWPIIFDEMELMHTLLSTSDAEWAIARLTNIVVSLDSRLVTGTEDLAFDMLQAKDQERLEAEAALKAFKIATGAPQKKRAKPDQERPLAKSVGEILDSSSEEEADRDWRELIQATAQMSRAASHGGGGVAPAGGPADGAASSQGGSVAAAVGREDGAASGQGAATARAPPGSRSVERVGFNSIAAVMDTRKNCIIGFGITCKRHRNRMDEPGVICKKVCTLGNSGMSHDEARRRLKRWYVAGLSDDIWETEDPRTYHLKLGGTQLMRFGDDCPDWAGISEADLDLMASMA